MEEKGTRSRDEGTSVVFRWGLPHLWVHVICQVMLVVYLDEQGRRVSPGLWWGVPADAAVIQPRSSYIPLPGAVDGLQPRRGAWPAENPHIQGLWHALPHGWWFNAHIVEEPWWICRSLFRFMWMARQPCRLMRGKPVSKNSMVRVCAVFATLPNVLSFVLQLLTRTAICLAWAAVIFPSLLQLQRGITDVEDKKQKAVCMERYRKKDEDERCSFSDIDVEREEECGICMEMNSKVVLPNCTHAMCLRCYQDWYALNSVSAHVFFVTTFSVIFSNLNRPTFTELLG